ncbi:hypothetical protein M8C21_006613 [Ambrosia artemisiifolia]|uniref:Uncharacterized protein n=1 Tax=Ambrosia artemisiifolia TaxID=4212 RepID=A0AAD5CVN5_AMBAR|nr:hypothetical protein M8C21_006613 [Ambrosia artemisiifolia]
MKESRLTCIASMETYQAAAGCHVGVVGPEGIRGHVDACFYTPVLLSLATC